MTKQKIAILCLKKSEKKQLVIESWCITCESRFTHLLSYNNKQKGPYHVNDQEKSCQLTQEKGKESGPFKTVDSGNSDSFLFGVILQWHWNLYSPNFLLIAPLVSILCNFYKILKFRILNNQKKSVYILLLFEQSVLKLVKFVFWQ